jgi:hypothetical protein
MRKWPKETAANPTLPPASAIQIRQCRNATKALKFNAPQKPYSRAKVQSFREKGARESDIGAAPRDQSQEICAQKAKNSPLWKRDLAAENGARKSPGGGSATAIQLYYRPTAGAKQPLAEGCVPERRIFQGLICYDRLVPTNRPTLRSSIAKS